VRRPAGAPPPLEGPGRAAEPRRIDAGDVALGVDLDAVPFAWDAELGHARVRVPAFELDSLPVRNADWLAFLERASPGDRARLAPQAWIGDGRALAVKTVLGRVPFELARGWPVQVTNEQARAYASAHGARLPTEAELHRAAYVDRAGARRTFPWGDAAPDATRGSFDLEAFAPVPVGSHPEGASAWGVEELVGNGWEHTSTTFAPLPGFRAWARTYPGYAADFFDGAHDVVFGASWATDASMLRPSFRNWYRRDYPWAFTSFRLARPA
jgi:formylglycine-generating enzyme required for sulfatase activity